MKLHLYDSQGIVLVYFSDNSLLLCEKKRGEKILRSRQTRDSLLSRINGKVQLANVKKWRENCDHVVAIAIHDSGKRGAKCPCWNVFVSLSKFSFCLKVSGFIN